MMNHDESLKSLKSLWSVWATLKNEMTLVHVSTPAPPLKIPEASEPTWIDSNYSNFGHEGFIVISSGAPIHAWRYLSQASWAACDGGPSPLQASN